MGDTSHLVRGVASERAARLWLEQRGLRHVSSNFRCRNGELDLIMRDGETLVIVEVRYRRNSAYGGPLHSISLSKQRKICLATQRFLQEHVSMTHLPLRFDVVALSGALWRPHFEWRKQAFFYEN